MDKAGLRASVLARRRELRESLGESGWVDRGERIAQSAMQETRIVAAYLSGETIASYLSYGTEPPTAALNERLSQKTRVVVPVHEINGQPLDELGWVDLEPSEASTQAVGAAGLVALGCTVLIMPALAAGRDGTRLGKGKGYYDKLLAKLPRCQDDPAGPIRIALVGPADVFGTVPTEAHDEQVDRLLIG